ncbi:Zinc finger protein sdc-3 [Caenorhabditis elegans] [Rhizoctonia solani]|uniref:Zinc finger protein sdc-3 [Caenorhabditis elegans] n=1 Tax=Rhizoctonia solani TaxID=456999 RepID=A0A0K6GGG7_9AGAM|nr:Zinc finger protein sdc-3 [Caenorhabditis elegans] [Rhizoctonia solani]
MPQKTLPRPKRRKAKKDDPYPDLALDRCYLAELPLEVLANILGYVYPIDLLTLSRTNAYFHRTLRDPQQQHIWKTARVHLFHVIIPDPVRISEVRVASLLFDDSKCSICKDTSNVPLKSHVYPTRVCSRPSCKKQFDSLFQSPAPEYSTLVCGIVPSKDVIAPDPYAFYHTPVLMFQRKKNICRKTDLEMVMKDIKAGLGKAELEAKYKCTFEETAEFNRYMVELENISSTLIRLKCQIDGQIKKFTNQKLSAYKGKDVQVTNSPQFVAERRRVIRSYREITQEDWDAIPPRGPTQNPIKPAMTVGQTIIQEMDQMVAKSKRRKDEDALRNTREAVKKHWEYMLNASGIAGDSGAAVPRWNEFASLPVVNSLLKPTGHDEALGVKDLKKKDSTLAKLIQSDINSWDNRTQAQFRKILKVPKAPTIKKNEAQEPGIVSPLDQVTALFECTKCKALGKGVAQEGTLTFRSAVKHRCPNTSSTKFKWSTDLFQPDQYAIQVARHAIALSGLTEDKTKRSDMDALGARFHCKLCTGKQPIYLSYHNLIGHLKRHEAKELQDSFEYLKEPPVLKSTFPSSDGLVEMRRRGATKGFSSRPDSKDFFTCRHCDKSMLWNGLVSHVKKKHSFSDIRDEDFYPNRKEL